MATAEYPWERALGAVPGGDGTVEFRVWAPHPERVDVRVRGADHGSRPRATASAARASRRRRRRLRLRARRPRAARPGEPLAARGPARAVAGRRPAALRVDRRRLARRPRCEDAVLYELHVGTFTAEGTFEARDRAPARAAPSSASPTSSSCRSPSSRAPTAGATTASTSAPRSRATAGRTACSGSSTPPMPPGSASILDVVYNHLGASGIAAMEAFGPTSPRSTQTFWGKAINFDDADCDPVREWVLQSAEGWIRDFHVDGLRLDAIHAIFDIERDAHPPASSADRVHARNHRALVIAESGLNDPKVIRPRGARRLGLRRRVGRRLPPRAARAAHRRRDGLLRGVRRASSSSPRRSAARTSTTATTRPSAAAASARPPTTAASSSSSSSTRTTTRSATAPSATACRPRSGRSPRSARCCRRTCRCCSWARSTARPRRSSSSPTTSTRRSPIATREGRRREFAAFARLPAEEVPDPQDAATFERSKLTRDEATPAMRALYGACSTCAASCRAGADADAVDCDAAGPLAARAPRRRSRSSCNFAATPAAVPRRRGADELVARHPRRRAPGRRPRRPARPRRSARAMSAPPDTVSREVWPGRPFPLGATWDGHGTNFSLFSENADARRALPVRRRRPRGARSRSSSGTAHIWHCYLPGVGPGQRYGYRVARPLRPVRRAPLQPGQAADRPVRQGDRGRRSAGTRRTCCPTSPDGTERRRPRARRRGRRRGDPEVDRRRRGLRLGGRRAAAHAVERDRHLRDPRQGLHDAPPGRARGPARHLRRPGVRARRSATSSDLGVTAVELLPIHHIADESFLHERGLTNYWGYSSIGYLAPHAALRRDRHARRAGARVQGHGQGAAPRRHRGDPRRRLQPHRRGQPPRPDAVVQGRRQRELLPAHARRPRATTWTSRARATRSTSCTRASCG